MIYLQIKLHESELQYILCGSQSGTGDRDTHHLVPWLLSCQSNLLNEFVSYKILVQLQSERTSA